MNLVSGEAEKSSASALLMNGTRPQKAGQLVARRNVTAALSRQQIASFLDLRMRMVVGMVIGDRGGFVIFIATVQDLTRQLNIIISELSDLSIIDAFDFCLFAAAQMETGNDVDDEEDGARSEEGVEAAGNGISDLVAELLPVVVEESSLDYGVAIKMCYVVGGEESGEDVADQSSNGVDREDVKGVINFEEELELRSIVGTGGSYNTIDDRCPSRHETRPRSDCDGAGDNTRAEPNRGPLLLKTIVEDTPSNTTSTSSQIGNDCCHDGAHIGGKGRTSIESKPTNPEENGSNDDVSDIVGAVIEFMSTVTAALAQHDRICQCSTTG